MPVTRGFYRKRPEGSAGRLPPGQYDTGSTWPVLTAEATPQIRPEAWTLSVDGLVDRPTTWTWDEAHRLPRSTYVGDIHCVTTWSKFDVTFAGVSVDDLLGAAGPQVDARFVLAHSSTAYTTNLSLADLTGGRAWVVWEYDGHPLPFEHGGRRGCWCRTSLLGVRHMGLTAGADGRGPAALRARPALRHAVARSRRIHCPALLLRRLARSRPPGQVPRRAAARRRGLDPPRRRRRGRRRAGAARPDRPLVPLGRSHTGVRVGRRHRGGAGGVDAADRPAPGPQLVGAEVVFVCGSPRFAQLAESLLRDCDVDPRASGSSSSARPAEEPQAA